MRKKTTVVVNGKKKVDNTKTKLIAVTILLLILILMIVLTLISFISNNKFAKEIDEFSKLNSKTVFSIDKIYMYSSADADNLEENNAMWRLNIHQFTDIALYINNRKDVSLNYENSIKKLYIDNVRFSGLEKGEACLSFENAQNFGRFSNIEENVIGEKLEYEVLNDGDIDYSKPQIYADCSNPILLEYANKNIKENYVLSDLNQEIKYNGELLRKAGIFLDSIKCNLAFDITIINNYNQKFVANVYLDIPLEDTQTGDTIYNGKIVKKIENTNQIRFFRVG